MAFRLHIPGVGDVVCDTAQEIVELRRAFEAEKRPDSKAKTGVNGSASSPQLPLTPAPNPDEEALAVLRAIKAHTPRITPASALVKALGVAHPKGLGSALARINLVIKQTGFEPENVMTSQRTQFGREYRAGSDFAVALAALESKTAQ